jgi:hypothetical protein
MLAFRNFLFVVTDFIRLQKILSMANAKKLKDIIRFILYILVNCSSIVLS